MISDSESEVSIFSETNREIGELIEAMENQITKIQKLKN
jgi:hypothetical protein